MKAHDSSFTLEAVDCRLQAASRPTEVQLNLAHTIVEYLCCRGMNPGNHLTEQELVDEFHISRTPLRAALSYLAERGVFERRRNRGFFVKLDRERLRKLRLALPRTVEDRLLRAIAEDWFALRVPQAFSEVEFRRRYGIGRSLAARVLFRLSEDGIVSRNRGHGWRFESPLRNAAIVDESYAFRIAIEPAAILAPSFELDRGLAEQCRRRHEVVLSAPPEDAPHGALSDIDNEFHRTIGLSSRNRFFLAAIERQIALRHFIELATNREESRLPGHYMDHMEILTAIERGEREEAAELMHHHLVSAHRCARRPLPDVAQTAAGHE